MDDHNNVYSPPRADDDFAIPMKSGTVVVLQFVGLVLLVGGLGFAFATRAWWYQWLPPYLVLPVAFLCAALAVAVTIWRRRARRTSRARSRRARLRDRVRTE